MAGPSLGTLLIQRLDAALGTTLSQQTQIVNRATSNPVPHPGQTVRPEPISNTLVRDGRTNVERATLGTRSGGRVAPQPGTADPGTTGRTAGQGVTSSATTSLGPAARIILNLFADHIATPSPVSARAPLISLAPNATMGATVPSSNPGAQTAASGAPVSTAPATESTTTLSGNLARALSQSLQQSGLFYESHLRSMVSGQYRLADIRQEPQAQIPTTAQRAEPGPFPGIDPGSHNIVRQQLEALADQSMHWRGEAWPGAAMEWHVRRQSEQKDAPAPASDDDAPWQSQMTLHLPQLGTISLDIRLAGTQVHVRMQARDDTATLLQQHVADLRGQMSDRQLELTTITVAQHDGEAQ